MTKNKSKNREETQSTTLSLSEQAGNYEAPALEVVEIRLEQHILQSASGGELPDMNGNPWG
jgi:hypothetical protein